MSTRVAPERYIVEKTLSDAWLAAVRLLYEQRRRSMVHLVLRILDPTEEVREVRHAAAALIASMSSELFPDIETTRNTIFPAAWARRMPDPRTLSSYYRARYTKAGLLGFRGNAHGTYFGRMVAYPHVGGHPADQLSDTVDKLQGELATAHPKSSRYEINIYNEALDRSPMGFPCLAHVGIHLHDRRLHMQAVYRHEYLIARAYGNYLGLAELQCYLAAACSIAPGELLVTIGHATLDVGRTRIVPLLRVGQDSPSDEPRNATTAPLAGSSPSVLAGPAQRSSI